MRQLLLVSLTLGVFCGASCSRPGAPSGQTSSGTHSETTAPAAVKQSAQGGSADTAHSADAPEVVRVESVQIAGNLKKLRIGNTQGRYLLSCNQHEDSCFTPAPGKDYLLYTKETRSDKGPKDLAWFEDWYGSYKNVENVGLFGIDDAGIGVNRHRVLTSVRRPILTMGACSNLQILIEKCR
jgi:hypothetical protein